MNATSLATAAEQLSDVLERTQTQIVFAESCTGGLVSASLAGIPGISRWLCGSAVTYQEQTKIDWLAVSPADLQQHTAVSAAVTLAMATGALETTTAAEVAVAVTGHLGPGAPADRDGVIFIAAARRGSEIPPPRRIVLSEQGRAARQAEAARLVLQVSMEFLAGGKK